MNAINDNHLHSGITCINLFANPRKASHCPMVHEPAPAAGGASFRHDPRMRRAFSGLGQKQTGAGVDTPAATAVYWLLRSRRPKLAALAGRLSPADLLVTGCAVADSGGKLIVEPDHDHPTRQALAHAGLDWVVRSGECLPCIRSIRPLDALIIGESHAALDGWPDRLGRNALLLGLSRNAAAMPGLAERMLDQRLATEIARLRDGRRYLLIAEHEPG